MVSQRDMRQFVGEIFYSCPFWAALGLPGPRSLDCAFCVCICLMAPADKTRKRVSKCVNVAEGVMLRLMFPGLISYWGNDVLKVFES